MNSIGFVKKILNLICHLLIAIHLYIFWWNYIWNVRDHYKKDINGNSERQSYSTTDRLKFDLHVTHALMSVTAIAFLFPEGLLMFCPTNYTNKLSGRKQRFLHFFWFGTSFVLILIASLLALIKFQFHGAHDYLGLTTLIFITFSTMFGFIMTPTSMHYNRSVRLVHYISGLIGYIIGMITLAYGYHRFHCNSSKRWSICEHKWEMTLALIAICIISLISPVEIVLNRHINYN